MNGAPQSSIFVIVVQLNKLDIWMIIAWLSFSVASRTYQISFRLFSQLQTWHMIPFYRAWSIITANQCAALQILPTIVPRPFLIFITRWYWQRRNGLSPTPCLCVALPYNFRQNALAEELSGSTDRGGGRGAGGRKLFLMDYFSYSSVRTQNAFQEILKQIGEGGGWVKAMTFTMQTFHSPHFSRRN